jgi:hypothetical protein
MDADQEPALPEIGERITSACGGSLDFEPDTPRTVHQRRWVFFCLPSCQEDFERDPFASCLSEDL